jgi:anti-sigma regulatory factor (Ser/Thr protein kinase)
MIATDPRTGAVTARRTFGGVRESAGQARAWARDRLAAQDVAVPTDLLLILSELAANAVQHTRSGLVGGTFAVRLVIHPDRVRVEVRDNGPLGRRVPVLRVAALNAERGRGLLLVQTLAHTWGHLPTGSGVYAEVPR